MKQSKISELLEKINKTLDGGGPGNLSKIEYDILMKNVRELYEELGTLRAGNTVQHTSIAETNKPELKKEEAPVTRKTFLANEGFLLKEQPKEKEVIVEEKKPATHPEGKSEKVRQPVVSINERVSSTGGLNEKHKVSAGKEMHKKLASKPLKELIGLNQRFVILNELFKGNAEAFAAAVNHIDSLNDYDTAGSFIQTQLVSNYYWDETSQSAKLFYKLVKQKFGVE